jgi:hypothetical protein
MSNIRREYKRTGVEVYPLHEFVHNWKFEESEEAEAELAHAIAVVAEKNGVGRNEVMHLFPGILRMLKSNIQWSK